MSKPIENFVSKYTKIIHPKDLGKETSQLEAQIREDVSQVVIDVMKEFVDGIS